MKSELKALLSTIIIMNVSLSFLVFLRIVLPNLHTNNKNVTRPERVSKRLFRNVIQNTFMKCHPEISL